MTPNLFLATQTLFSPHKWFRHHPKPVKLARTTEHWDSPVPGIYEYIPGRGWYLIAEDKNKEDSKAPEGAPVPPQQLHHPVQVRYSKVLKRYLLAPDYEMRKRPSWIQNENGRKQGAIFFQLDDGVSWVMAWDCNGEFIPGPYKLWVPDGKTGAFRHMLKSDDPRYAGSRRSSTEDSNARSNSQDSRSTQYMPGRPSITDGRSHSGARMHNYSGKSSAATSRSNTRHSSPTGTSIPFSEATTLQNSTDGSSIVTDIAQPLDSSKRRPEAIKVL